MAKMNVLNGWTKTLITVAGIIFAAGILYACVTNNSFRIKTNTINIKEVDNKADKNCNDVTGLSKDVFYIRKQVDTNAKVQQQILTEIKELQK